MFIGDDMNKFQKLCLLISVLACIDFSLDVLLDMSFIIQFIPSSSIWYKVYACVIGVIGFVNLTLFDKISKFN